MVPLVPFGKHKRSYIGGWAAQESLVPVRLRASSHSVVVRRLKWLYWWNDTYPGQAYGLIAAVYTRPPPGVPPIPERSATGPSSYVRKTTELLNTESLTKAEMNDETQASQTTTPNFQQEWVTFGAMNA